MMAEVDRDHHWMSQALLQAKSAQFRTRPNPAVGCVIVKDEQIIGRGATAQVKRHAARQLM